MPVVLCSLAYLYQVLELKNWEIPLGMVDGMRVQYLLIIVVGIFYCFSASYLQEYIRSKFDIYIPNYIAKTFLRKNLKKMAKQLSIGKEKDIEEEITRARKTCNKLRLNIVKIIASVVLLGSICFFPFYALFFLIVLRVSIVSVFLFYVLTISSTVICAYYFSSRQTKKEIRATKKQIKNDGKTPESYIDACENVSKKESKRVENVCTSHDEGLNVTRLDRFTVPITAIVMFFICMLLNLCSPPQKDYWIYTDDNGNSFASVFDLGDGSILKHATIENDEIIIFLDDQIYIKTTGIPMKHVSFKKVTIEKEKNS